MANYRVVWEIDIDAESLQEAAEMAERFQRNQVNGAEDAEDAERDMFRVFDEQGAETHIDLAEMNDTR